MLKVVSPQILHKSDVGGVRMGLSSREEVQQAMRETEHLPGLAGWLLEEMAAPGLELVIGGSRHPRFGPMVMVGLGGVLVEYLEDVSLRICPVTPADARDMLASLRSALILDGVRGGEPVDKEAVVDLLCRVGGPDGLLVQRQAAISELDLNPVIASAEGVVAVDARVIVSAAEPEETPCRLCRCPAAAAAERSSGGRRVDRRFGLRKSVFATPSGVRLRPANLSDSSHRGGNRWLTCVSEPGRSAGARRLRVRGGGRAALCGVTSIRERQGGNRPSDVGGLR